MPAHRISDTARRKGARTMATGRSCPTPSFGIEHHLENLRVDSGQQKKSKLEAKESVWINLLRLRDEQQDSAAEDYSESGRDHGTN